MSVQRTSPSSATSGPTAAESDLDVTAELPVLDVAAYESAVAEARTGNTDTWILPSPGPAEPKTAEVPAAVSAAAPAAVALTPATQLEVSLHSLSDNLREVEERLGRKGERLAEIEKALAQANAARAAAEQQAQQLKTELAEKLALQGTSLSLVQEDLTRAQALATRYYESLQSMEGRRSIFQEISTSLYWEVDERDVRLNRAEGQLAAAIARSRDLESKLIDRSARIAKLEKEMSGLGVTVTQRDEALRDSVRTSDDLKRNAETLATNLAARDERIKTLESDAAKQSVLLAERQAELDRAAAEKATLIASVNSLESRLAETNKRAAELAGSTETAHARHEELETAGATQRKRTEQVEAELAAVRAELEQRSAALADAGTERGEHMARIAASETRVQDLEARTEEQQESVRVLQADSNASVARAKELESDLRAAEDMIHRLEADLRGRVARLDELEKTSQQWRATVEEAQNALTERDSLIRRLEEETTNSAVLLGAIQQRLESSGSHEIAPEGDKRLLIRSEGDSEVVHVLGRKTSIGRTPDNDLQIDAKFVSRHHAVILAGPAHTIIEDLNSTNGVLVNGRRITRQTLKDGDAVMVGKAMFRFAVRPAHERGLKSV